MNETTWPADFVPTVPVQPAEASTELGTDDIERAVETMFPEGFAIALLATVAAIVAALMLAHFVATA